MSAAYGNNPEASERDAVRFLCGDTVAPFTFTDEEINFLIKNEANVYTAAANLCDKMVTKIGGGLASKSVGSLSESYSQSGLELYITQAKQLRLMSGHQIPWCAEIEQKFSFRQFERGIGNPALRNDRTPVYIDEETE